jgi:RNA polymerase sigma-70 factor (ECF subfamily)
MRASTTVKQERFNNEMLPHMDTMYHYALFLTHDRDAAQDLLQETFLKSYRFLDKFKEGTNEKAWLYRIMRNTYINNYRREKRIPDLVEYDDQISAYQMQRTETIDRENLSARIDTDLFEDEISSAIATLPERYKSVIVMRDVEEMPYEEIAEALEIPLGTVRSRLHRARAILFDLLKGYARKRGYSVGERFAPADLVMAG